jgi:hypothetical protein
VKPSSAINENDRLPERELAILDGHGNLKMLTRLASKLAGLVSPVRRAGRAYVNTNETHGDHGPEQGRPTRTALSKKQRSTLYPCQ